MKSDDAALTACKAFLDDAAENGVYRLFAPLCLDTFARAKHGREIGDDALRWLDAACVVFFRDRAPWPVADRAQLHRRWCALLFEVHARAVGVCGKPPMSDDLDAIDRAQPGVPETAGGTIPTGARRDVDRGRRAFVKSPIVGKRVVLQSDRRPGPIGQACPKRQYWRVGNKRGG